MREPEWSYVLQAASTRQSYNSHNRYHMDCHRVRRGGGRSVVCMRQACARSQVILRFLRFYMSVTNDNCKSYKFEQDVDE